MKRIGSFVVAIRQWSIMPWIVIVIILAERLSGWSQGSSEAPAADDRRNMIRQAFDSFPNVLGSERQWLYSGDVEVPTRHSDMLGLNSYLSRTYMRLGTSPTVKATIFIANSRDARSMVGHHPPHCYPAVGWSMTETPGGARRQFSSALQVSLPAAVYRFDRGKSGDRVQWVVNGFLMPGGRCAATLKETNAGSAGLTVSRLGLTQYQIVFLGDLQVSDVVEYAGEIIDAIPGNFLEAVMSTVLPDDEGRAGGDT